MLLFVLSLAPTTPLETVGAQCVPDKGLSVSRVWIAEVGGIIPAGGKRDSLTRTTGTGRAVRLF